MLNPYFVFLIFIHIAYSVSQQYENIEHLTKTNGVIVPLSNLFNLYHVGQIQIGYPPRQVTILFDTGSTLSWIDVKCIANGTIQSCVNTKSPVLNRFGTPLNKKFCIHYDDGGRISGRMHKSWIQIGYSDSSTIMTHAQIGLASRIDEETLQRPYDGIIALGFQQKNSSRKHESVVEKLVERLPYRLFTVHLNVAANAPNSIIFGAVPAQECSQDALFTPLISTKDWQFQALAVYANGQQITNGSIKIVADTGTSALLMPKQTYHQFLKALGLSPNQGPIPIVDCSLQVDLQIQLGFNASLIFTQTNLLLRYGYLCALQIAPTDSNLWIFGAPSFQQYCHIFDVSKQRIGFSKKLQMLE